MINVFSNILNMTLTASIMIIIVLLARLCLKKAPKIYSYILWSVVLFRLLCPFSLSMPISILSPMAQSSTQSTSVTATMEYVSIPIIRENAPSAPLANNTEISNEGKEGGEDNATNAAVPSQNTEVSSAPAEHKNLLSAGEIIMTVFGWIWFAGLFVFLGITVWQNILLKRRLDTAFLIRGNIYESENIDTAFIFGVFNPRIYLPLGLSFDVQKTIVAHEQTHQRRGDHIIKAVAYFVLALHWFNPLVWYSFKLMCDDMEKSCDEAVVRTMYDRGYTMKSVKYAYGQMLLVLGGGKQHIFSPVSFAENSTKSRVKNVIAYERTARNAAIVLGLVCAFIIGLCVINPTGVSAETDISENGHSPDAKLISTECGDFWSDTKEITLYDIEDISFLKDFTNLYSLTIQDVHPNDWSELKYCTELKELYVFHEPFEINIDNKNFDISFLEYCPNIKTLYLADGMIEDISPLKYCTELEDLQLWYISGIKNYDVIESFSTLKRLTIAACTGFSGENDEPGCDLTKLAQLEYLDVTTLMYTEEPEYDYLDLSFLKQMPNLKELRSNIYRQEDAEIIGSLTQLEGLDICVCYPAGSREDRTEEDVYNSIKAIDLSPLKNMTNLRKLTVSASDFIAPFWYVDTNYIYSQVSRNLLESIPCDNLEYLDTYGWVPFTTSVTDNLTQFSNLKYLNCSLERENEGSPATIDFVKYMSKLESLSCTLCNGLLDVSAVDQLQSLNSLVLDALEYTGTEAIGNLKELKSLEIYGNQDEGFSDVSFLNNLTNLEKLDISLGYFVNDLSFISSNKNMKELIMVANYSDLTGLSALTELERLVIWQNENHMYNNYMYEVSEEDYASGNYEESEYLTEVKRIDISPLSGMTNLKEINIQNMVVDLSLLDNCQSLEHLELHYYSYNDDPDMGNRMYWSQIESFKNTHPGCSIYCEGYEES